jgi:hypothetical protein
MRTRHLREYHIPTLLVCFLCNARHLYLVYNVLFDGQILHLLVKILLSYTKPIPKQFEMRPHNNGILNKLLHTIHQPIPIPTRQQPSTPTAISPLILKLLPRSLQTTLIWDSKHSHPPAQYPQAINSVKALTPTVDLNYR